jgi:hypothetical protein
LSDSEVELVSVVRRHPPIALDRRTPPRWSTVAHTDLESIAALADDGPAGLSSVDEADHVEAPSIVRP